MKKLIYDYVFNHLPRLWFARQFAVQNQYQSYVYSRDCLAAYDDTLKKLTKLWPVFEAVVKGKRFLELGCDTGFFPMQAGLLGAAAALGLDRNQEALAQAEAARRRLGLANVGFRQASIPDLGLSQPFDTVLFLSTIHYMFSDKEGNRLLFTSMDGFVAFLAGLTAGHLLIEFVLPPDQYVQRLVASGLLASGEYSLPSFLAALRRHFPVLADLGPTHLATRRLYLACRHSLPTILTPLA
jgi:SAM-dependent methyltransferase